MVRLSLLLLARPGQVGDLVAELRTLMLRARGERGFVTCNMSVSLSDRDALRYVEEWSDELDLRDQIRSDRFHRLICLMEAAAEPPHFEVQLDTGPRGLDYVEDVLRGEAS